MHRKLLVPLDGSRTSLRGLDEAIRFARGADGRLRLLHVLDETPALGMMEEGVDLAPFLGGLEKRGRAILARGKRLADGAGVPAETGVAESAGGPAADAILREAKRWGADLIVMGTHGRRGLRHVAFGSQADQVIRRSAVPVLLVRARG